jgi:hypothetical protein
VGTFEGNGETGLIDGRSVAEKKYMQEAAPSSITNAEKRKKKKQA